MALGARRSDVLKMVMSQGLRLIAIGLAIGLCAAFGAARLLSPLLYGIGTNDPATMVAVALGLATIALSACYLPATKAMRVDPSTALRYEGGASRITTTQPETHDWTLIRLRWSLRVLFPMPVNVGGDELQPSHASIGLDVEDDARRIIAKEVLCVGLRK